MNTVESILDGAKIEIYQNKMGGLPVLQLTGMYRPGGRTCWFQSNDIFTRLLQHAILVMLDLQQDCVIATLV